MNWKVLCKMCVHCSTEYGRTHGGGVDLPRLQISQGTRVKTNASERKKGFSEHIFLLLLHFSTYLIKIEQKSKDREKASQNIMLWFSVK